MRILAIESSTGVCAAALIDDGRVQSEHSLNTPHVHSEKLITLIDTTLKESRCSIERVDGIAISIGPGSFTGLRIGLSVAKGLAFAYDKPLIAVPTLRALALNALQRQFVLPGGIIVPMIDARRDEVFTASYRVNQQTLVDVTKTRALLLEEIYQQVQSEPRVVITGNGAEKFQQFLQREKPGETRFFIPSPDQRECSASVVGFIGEEMLRLGEIADMASLEPMYVKDFTPLVKKQHAEVH